MAKALKTTSTASAKRSVAPETTTQTDHGHAHPRIPVEPPFVLIFVPQRWAVLGGRLVPRLTKLPLVRGVQLVDQDKQGRWQMHRLRARLEEEGRTLIPWAWAPDGVSYVAEVATYHRGELTPTHISCFASVHAGDTTIYADEDAYAAWLAQLIEDERLPPCPPHLAAKMLEERRAAFVNAEVLAEKHPSASRRAKVEVLRREVAVLAEAVGDGPSTSPVATKTAAPAINDEPPPAKKPPAKKTPKKAAEPPEES